MTLDGWPFLGTLIALAALTTAGTVWFWPRLARQAPGPVAMRLGLLVTTQIMVMTAALAGANIYFGFFTSWTDLFGTDTTRGKVVQGSSSSALGPAAVTFTQKTADLSAGPDPQRDGKIQFVDMKGVRSGLDSPAYVYLPPAYYQKGNETRRFPVVVVLSGYPGDAKNLITRLGVVSTAQQEMKAGRLQPTVFVLMRSSPAYPRDTECTDVPGGPQAATYFTQDMPEVIKAHYRVSANRSGWGMMGDSTGGYCSLKLVMRNSDRFSAAAALSGYYTTMQDITTGDLYGGSKLVRAENDLFWRLKSLPQPPISVMVTSSKKGERGYISTEQFLAAVHAPMHADSIILDQGGHNFNTWRRVLGPAMQWMSGKLTA